ncbi:MAG: hypothetical protein IGS49_14675 [Chlorogloeopsis fritschii C42_A2020_084]|uniref:phthiocerol/phthiodiolone dimycocerosyl transferase family protein n=1 Tax=Chlorogloeopsis fritschii TaxID=1124 RepID=UPI0019F91CAC|nr:hypothetical protein [Chlorogloeopsis fritschii]MBF2006670.1 hypothetical protein [Chlorogloeopsis fritschii C42_A2020_084]
MQRELGISERVVWLLSEAGSNNFVIIAKISGFLSEPILRQALILMQKKHPLLDVHIELVGETPQFVSAGTPEIPLRILELNSADDWIPQANIEMNLPFCWQQEPLVRLVWLKAQQEQIILVTFHHAIGDAKAGTYFVRDLLAIASEIIDNDTAKSHLPLPERPPSDELIPANFQGIKGAFNVIEGGLRQGLMLTKQPKKIPPEKDVPVAEVRTYVIHKTLPPEITQLMKKSCQGENTSVHGLICALMLKAVGNRISAKEKELIALGCFSTINIRNLLTPQIGDEIGLYVSGISTFHQVGKNTPVWDLAREVKNNLARLLEKGEAFATLMLQKNLLRKKMTPLQLAQQANQFFLSATCVTNLGQLDIPQKYGTLELEALHFCVAGNAFPGGGIGVAATTFNGQATFNFLFGVPLMSADTAEAIVNDVLETLNQAIGVS